MQTKTRKYTAGGDQVTKAPKVAPRERKERTAQKTENLERIISRREGGEKRRVSFLRGQPERLKGEMMDLP